MPQGNYAARICHDRERDLVLLWSFFFRDGDVQGDHLLPPPKEIAVEKGHLRLRSYRGFDRVVTGEIGQRDFLPLELLFGNLGARAEDDAD